MNKKTLQNQILAFDKWKNADNAEFYENLPIEAFKQLAEKGGLTDCCDVKVIEKLCEKAEHILEVGPGYGRVCDYLIRSGIKGKLHVVERNKRFCKLLNEQFGNSINLYEGDFLDLKPSLQFDVILMMWTGEVAKAELPIFLKKSKSLLSEKGAFVIDIISGKKTLPLETTKASEDSYCLSLDNKSKIYGYFFDENEIEKVAMDVGFKAVEHHPYETSKGRPRVSHWFFV